MYLKLTKRKDNNIEAANACREIFFLIVCRRYAGVKIRIMKAGRTSVANKALVQTAPARGSFGIRARHKRFGGCVGAFLPHRARVRLHNAGVSNTL